MHDWNYDTSCVLTQLPLWDSKELKRLIIVVQSVQHYKKLITKKWLLNVADGWLAFLLHTYEIPG
jgi:hypothetical protein